eukprot:SAG31_NODE_332_length_17516_cov_3.552840_15_plen_352_part_00
MAGCTDTKAFRRGDGGLAIVTELAAHGDLRQVILAQPMEVTSLMWFRMLLDISRGVGYLHSRAPPIVHRDLKPQNCLVDQFWHVRVGDFGISNHIVVDDEDEDIDQVLDSMRANRDIRIPVNETMAAYMAPELMRQTAYGAQSSFRASRTGSRASLPSTSPSRRSSRRSSISAHALTEVSKRKATAGDIWAFGVIVWAVVARERPFHASGGSGGRMLSNSRSNSVETAGGVGESPTSRWSAAAVIQHVLSRVDSGLVGPLDLPTAREGSTEASSAWYGEETVLLMQSCWHVDISQRPPMVSALLSNRPSCPCAQLVQAAELLEIRAVRDRKSSDVDMQRVVPGGRGSSHAA